MEPEAAARQMFELMNGPALSRAFPGLLRVDLPVGGVPARLGLLSDLPVARPDARLPRRHLRSASRACAGRGGSCAGPRCADPLQPLRPERRVVRRRLDARRRAGRRPRPRPPAPPGSRPAAPSRCRARRPRRRGPRSRARPSRTSCSAERSTTSTTRSASPSRIGMVRSRTRPTARASRASPASPFERLDLVEDRRATPRPSPLRRSVPRTKVRTRQPGSKPYCAMKGSESRFG